MRFLRATRTVRSVHEIDFRELWNEGKRGLIFDFDNTLGARGDTRLSEAVDVLLHDLQSKGFRIGVLTNRRRAESDPVIRALAERFPLIHLARKPSRKGYRRLLEELELEAGDTVMIGDRRLTDIFGANRINMDSILVQGL